MSSALLLDITSSVSDSTESRQVARGNASASRNRNPTRVDEVAAPEMLLFHELPVPVTDGRSLPLHSPWLVRVVHGANGPVVYDDRLLMFGQGRTLDEAAVDYGAAVLDYYEMLREDEKAGVLGQNQLPHLALLRRMFRAERG